MALCRLGEACLLEMAPFSRPHTQQHSEAHVWPRIAGIPGQGTSSLPSPFVLACLSINFSIWISNPPPPPTSACSRARMRARTQKHTHSDHQQSALRERRIGQGSSPQFPRGIAGRVPSFLLCAVDRMAFDCPWMQVLCTALSQEKHGGTSLLAYCCLGCTQREKKGVHLYHSIPPQATLIGDFNAELRGKEAIY